MTVGMHLGNPAHAAPPNALLLGVDELRLAGEDRLAAVRHQQLADQVVLCL
jgi:hypothetical protein